MAKSLNQRLSDLQVILAGLYIRSNDIRYINVYRESPTVVVIDGTVFLRVAKRLGLTSKKIGCRRVEDETRLEFIHAGIDFVCWLKSGAETLMQDLELQQKATRKKPKAAPKQKVASEQKPQPASAPPQPTIPRSASEARDFIYRHFHLPTWPGDREFLQLARRGQIKYHPDRPSGDGHLARVFNSCSSLLKEAMA